MVIRGQGQQIRSQDRLTIDRFSTDDVSVRDGETNGKPVPRLTNVNIVRRVNDFGRQAGAVDHPTGCNCSPDQEIGVGLAGKGKGFCTIGRLCFAQNDVNKVGTLIA